MCTAMQNQFLSFSHLHAVRKSKKKKNLIICPFFFKELKNPHRSNKNLIFSLTAKQDYETLSISHALWHLQHFLQSTCMVIYPTATFSISQIMASPILQMVIYWIRLYYCSFPLFQGQTQTAHDYNFTPVAAALIRFGPSIVFLNWAYEGCQNRYHMSSTYEE